MRNSEVIGVADDQANKAAKRPVSRRGPVALMAMLTPAIAFPVLLVYARTTTRFGWLERPSDYPWELWLVTICGTAATLGGVADWLFHRSGETSVGLAEHRSHVAALAGGGIPLFGLMTLASAADRPQALLLPILVVAGCTVILICYDEFVFHRKRCDRFETFTHRLLTLGNGAAWLAWVHWVFVRIG